MKHLLSFLTLLTISGLAYAQPKLTTYKVVTDSVASRATDKIITMVDTIQWPDGTKQWQGRDFGATLAVGAIPFGGTNSRTGGVFRNNTLFNFDSTNKYLGVNITTPTANIHGKGNSAASGNVMLLQNSAGTNVLTMANNSEFAIANSTDRQFQVRTGVQTEVIAGTLTTVPARVIVYGTGGTGNLLDMYNSSGDFAMRINCQGSGYIGLGLPSAGLKNFGLKLQPRVTGNAEAAADVAGFWMLPWVTAGANNQVLTSFLLKDSLFASGVFTGVTHNTLDIRKSDNTSLFKINSTGTPTATFSIPVKTTQVQTGVTTTTGATITMTTEETHICTSASGTTTVNFPTGVTGLTITVINQTAGGLTVTSYLDYTGAAQTTQAAQSSQTYIYDGTSWNRKN